jgi:DNA-binding MarR family transcriptional regulator
MANKDELVQQIHNMGFFISQNIEQNRLDCWIDLNLTMSQFKSLLIIEFQQNVCIRDLSKFLKMAQPNVTNMIELLVKEGLVSREENPEDRRMLILKTTPNGKKLIADLRDSISSEFSGYLERLSVEQLQALKNGIDPLFNVVKEINLNNNLNNPLLKKEK